MSARGWSEASYEGVHCQFGIGRPAPGVVALRISGWDFGEFGDLPMQEIEKDLTGDASLELFIDARDVKGATIDVSGEWSWWLGKRRASFKRISMLAATPFIQLTAEFVRRFAGLGDIMRIYTDASAFDAALAASVEEADGGARPRF